MAKAKADAFDASNEVASSFIKWGKEGDFILGTLISTRQVPSTLPDKKGELQFIYEIKVDSGEYHDIDEKKRVAEDPTTLDVGSTWSVGGRKTIDARMRQIKIGQKVGLKFIEELEAKTKGYNATKLIKVFAPKGADGTPEMDTEFLASLEAEKEF